MTVLPSFRKRRKLCHPETHPVTQACPGGPAEKACCGEGPVHSHLCTVSVVPLCSLRHPWQVPRFSGGGGDTWPRGAQLAPRQETPCTDRCAALCGQSNRVDPRRPVKRGEASVKHLHAYPPTHTLALPPRHSEGYRQDKGQFHLLREWLDPRVPWNSVGTHSLMGLSRQSEAWGGEHPQRQAWRLPRKAACSWHSELLHLDVPAALSPSDSYV